MQYVMFMIPSVYGSAEADEMPSPEMVDAMMTYNQELADAGVLESLNGLHPPTSGVQVRFGEDGSSVSDIESAGAVGGYWILNVSSHEAAVVLELRQIQEMDDFPEDVQDVVAGYDL